MKLRALALDFDGTIAEHGQLDPGVRARIPELRRRGIAVLLATGRMLEDLREMPGVLDLFDAVVAENGAQLSFPDRGHARSLAPAPPPALLHALEDQGIPHRAGRALVDARAADAPRILALLRELELPLVLQFNRSRVMVLPQGISKATGLGEGLAVLRRSLHNTVAIGDAENDHALLACSALSVAVAWGSPALQAMADTVLPGTGPADVADYLSELSRCDRLPPPPQPRRRLRLGTDAESRPQELGGDSCSLVAGDPASGKSWVSGLLIEQCILHGYSVCVLDPEGEHGGLDALPGVRLLDDSSALPQLRDLQGALRHADVSAVVNLSHHDLAQKREYGLRALRELSAMRRHTGLPHQIVVEEAHHFLRDPRDCEGLDLERGGYTLVSYQPAALPSQARGAADQLLLTRTRSPATLRALRAHADIRETHGALAPTLAQLELGEALVLAVRDGAPGAAPARVRLSPRFTAHVRHLEKYIDVPVAPGREFVFWKRGELSGPRARTLREFREALAEQSDAALGGHFERRDFSRWIRDVLGDPPLAERVHDLERKYPRRPGAPELVRELRAALRERHRLHARD